MIQDFQNLTETASNTIGRPRELKKLNASRISPDLPLRVPFWLLEISRDPDKLVSRFLDFIEDNLLRNEIL